MAARPYENPQEGPGSGDEESVSSGGLMPRLLAPDEQSESSETSSSNGSVSVQDDNHDDDDDDEVVSIPSEVVWSPRVNAARRELIMLHTIGNFELYCSTLLGSRPLPMGMSVAASNWAADYLSRFDGPPSNTVGFWKLIFITESP